MLLTGHYFSDKWRGVLDTTIWDLIQRYWYVDMLMVFPSVLLFPLRIKVTSMIFLKY
jgi:hypothetical protein